MYEPVREYVLVDLGGNVLIGNSLTESEALDCNLDLECDGALIRWELFQEAA